MGEKLKADKSIHNEGNSSAVPSIEHKLPQLTWLSLIALTSPDYRIAIQYLVHSFYTAVVHEIQDS